MGIPDCTRKTLLSQVQQALGSVLRKGRALFQARLAAILASMDEKPGKPTPSVSVRRWQGKVYVTAAYAPGSGTYIDKEPVLVCADTDAGAVGRNIITGLEAFVDGGDMPDWDTYQSPLLAAAGVSSWAILEKGSRTCAISQKSDRYLVQSDAGPRELTATAPS